MGRRLASATRPGSTKVNYTYNADGLRTNKIVNNEKYIYYWNGDKLTAQTWGENSMYFLYDGDTPIGLEFDGTEYYYVTNLQGDIIAILDSNGTCVVEYSYDAWGNCTIIRDTNTIAYINPLRYRGYYYDSDTDLYYLQSRYYDANTGRFINADDAVMTFAGVTNLFSYCENNPVMRIDPSGYVAVNLYATFNIIKNAIWLAASAFLTVKGYTVSKMMFKEALYGDRTLSSSQKNQIINKVKADGDFKKRIINTVKSLGKNVGAFGRSFDFEFTKADLYYAIHRSKCYMTGSKNKDVWTVRVGVDDNFDFTEWWSFKNHGAFATLSNNLGVLLQQTGALKAYSWSVAYTIKIDAKRWTII